MKAIRELEKIMEVYRLSGEGYSDEERRILKRVCKEILADIGEFERKKQKEKKEKQREQRKKEKEEEEERKRQERERKKQEREKKKKERAEQTEKKERSVAGK